MKERLLVSPKLFHNDFLSYYRSQVEALSNPDLKRIGDTNTIRKIISVIFQVIGEKIVDNIAGVYLSKLGYFGLWRSVNPIVYNKNTMAVMNEQSDGYMYILDYFPDTSKYTRDFQGWSIDKTFSQPLKERLKDNIRKGYRYKNYYPILKANKNV